MDVLDKLSTGCGLAGLLQVFNDQGYSDYLVVYLRFSSTFLLLFYFILNITNIASSVYCTDSMVKQCVTVTSYNCYKLNMVYIKFINKSYIEVDNERRCAQSDLIMK